MNLNHTHSLSHTKWNCKYHIVFAPKYRRKVFYGSKKLEIGAILRELCSWKEVNIIEAEVCRDHVHMLLEIPPKLSISRFIIALDNWAQNGVKNHNHPIKMELWFNIRTYFSKFFIAFNDSKESSQLFLRLVMLCSKFLFSRLSIIFSWPLKEVILCSAFS